MKAMTTDYNGNQLIRCPSCKASVTVEELHEHVNAKPESKREAIEHEIEMWGLTPYYDKQYLVENIVFCPNCATISHLSDWLEVSSHDGGSGRSKKR
jgi:hypothetical protein